MELLQDIQAGKQDTKASEEAIFFSVLAAAPQIPIQRLSREQRGLALYTLASRLQKQEAKFNPYMVACISIGYFTLSAM
jgi:hypothetical protein